MYGTTMCITSIASEVMTIRRYTNMCIIIIIIIFTIITCKITNHL